MNQPVFKNKNYDFSIYLLNHEGYYLPLQKDSILDLQIEENFLRWWSKGYIDIRNDHDFLEKPQAPTGRADPDNINAESFSKTPGTDIHNSVYSFRNDGEDMMVIKVQPNKVVDDTWYTMIYVMNVHSVTDIEGPSPAEKIKRLSFRDERYHQMLHTNLGWSTAHITPESSKHVPDADRSVSSGVAIKYLLTQVLGPGTAFDPEWDEGSDTLFYTSPANSTVADDLHYLLSSHVSTTSTGKCKCVLIFDRHNKFWRLMPVSTIFSHAAYYDDEEKNHIAGELQSEVFELINKPAGDDTSNQRSGHNDRIPVGGDKVYTNYNLENSSIIDSIKFYEMNGSDNLQYLNTTPVHMHDNRRKRFGIKQIEHSIGSAYKIATDLVSRMPRDRDQSPSISMNINPQRKYNIDIRHIYSSSNDLDGSKHRDSGINSNVFNSIMLSNAVEFRVPGETARSSGVFISVTPQSGDSLTVESIYNDKVYGQYLVTSVSHRFRQGDYTNKVVAVKPYNFRSIHLDTNVKEPENFESFLKSNPEPPKTIEEFFRNPPE